MKLKLHLQHDESDCAAACLRMLLGFYGRKETIRKLRIAAGTDTEGTSGYGIAVCAEKNGLTCKGFTAVDRGILQQIPFPAIFHTKTEQTEHYVVVESVKKDKVRVFDPADGVKKLPISDFNRLWTGIFFLCKPEESFEKKDENDGLFSRLFQFFKPHKTIAGKILLSSLLLTVFGVLISFYFRFLIDEVLYTEVRSTLNICSICYLMVILFQSILMYCRNQLTLYLGTKINISLICEFFNHLLKLPLSFFTARKTGEILSRLRDTETIRHTLSSTTVSVLLDSIMLLAGGGILLKLGSSLLYITMVPVIISGILVLLTAKIFKRLIRAKAIAEADKNAAMYETINGISTIKALSTEVKAFRRNEIKTVTAANLGIKLESFGNLNGMIQFFLSGLGTLLIFWAGSHKIFNGELSLGQLISFTTLSSFFLGPLSRLLTMQPAIQEAIVAAERLNDVMEIEEEFTEGNYCEEASALSDKIEIQNLGFSYGTRKKTLDNINCTINKGEKVAFVGLSGTGKSTLLKLLMKFYKWDEGSILFDSRDISLIKTSDYRKKIGYVPQESLLFSGTIAENIAWGVENFTPQMIYEAARKAEALDFIMALPEKFGTIVGENGTTLSGGERQRIALARILMGDPDVIILDEATASLDSISEKSIMKTINNLKGKTIIMVAHRLSTIKDCDKIFVLDKGTIKESGSHKELLEQNGRYKELWSAQNEE